MTTYQHAFDRVEDYLHHRPPYLMVDRILSITPEEVVTEKSITGEEFFLAGHFPGSPIFPGAMMQELSTQSAGILIAAQHNPMREFRTDDPHFNEYALGVLVKVLHARYKGFARPGDTLTARVTLNEQVGRLLEFSATLTAAGKTVMRNAFQLTNIPSGVLTGPS